MKLEKTSRKNIVIAIAELMILITGVFALSYILSPNALLPSADALIIPPSCCENPPTGEICKVVTDSNECGNGKLIVGVSCGNAAVCATGCCYNETTGVYDNNVRQSVCKDSFIRGDPNCVTANGAKRGCCIIGDSQTFFINQRQCELKTPRDKELNWSGDLNEMQCIVLQNSRNEGACITPNGDGSSSCRTTTRQDCLSESNFHEGYLCTSKELNTTCKKTKDTSCFIGKDEVYFIDSCGNKANIYNSLRINDDSYWEKIISKAESCGADSYTGNAKSTSCGNCDRFLGGICARKNESIVSPAYGNNICKDVSCVYKGKKYKNGESWCEYDSQIDEGNDAVGSRHWRYWCNYGNVNIIQCADYRSGMCIQKEMFESSNPNTKFSWADCVPNKWMACLSANNAGGDMTSCNQIPNCIVKTISMGNFTQNFCLSRVSPGFNVQSEEEVNSASGICRFGSKTCIVKESCVYDCRGNLKSCQCVENCECQGSAFTEKMNDICKSIGDCGLEYNIKGKYTKNFEVLNGTNSISAGELNRLKSFANPIAGKYLEPPNLSSLDYAGFPVNRGTEFPENVAAPGTLPRESRDDKNKLTDWLWPVGIGGVLVLSSSGFFGQTKDIVRWGDGWFGELDIINFQTGNKIAGGPGTVKPGKIDSGEGGLWGRTIKDKDGRMIEDKQGYGLMGGVVGAVAGWWLGGYVSKWMKHEGGSTGDYMARTGMALMGSSIGYSGRLDVGWNAKWEGSFSDWGFWVGVVIIAASYFFRDKGDKDECRTQTADRYRQISFICKPWTPPVGGEDCKSCNNDPTRPCSEYACNSRGASCKLLNKGTDHEICENVNSGDVNPPQIKGTISIDERIRYYRSGNNIEISGKSGGCLDPYMVYVLGLKTDEPSQCRYDFERKEAFENLRFELGNGYVYNHVSSVQIPGSSIFQNWDGKVTMYARCRDAQNNTAPLGDFFKIQMCINPARDLNPPIINSVPPNSSYIKINTTEQQVIVYTNEPAECRWSKDIKDYSVMENNLSCNNQAAQKTLLGWVCNVNLQTPSKKNTYYIRCKDQPQYAGINESFRMKNEESEEITLLKAETPLEITGAAPNGGIETTTLLTSAALKALTSGGAGNEVCSFSFTGYDFMIPFFKNDGNTHEQYFDNGLVPGNYKIFIECVDQAGDKARKEADFEIIYDANPAEINRIFAKGNSLKVYTAKDRECRYSSNQEERCNFDYTSGIQMGVSKEHTISITLGQKYYIKCANKFGEVPIGCTEIISPV